MDKSLAFQLKHGKIPWHLVLIFFLLAVGIGIVGYLYYEHQKKITAKAKQDELSAIADLKSQQIAIWRKERTGDATVIQDNPFIAPRVHQWLQNESASGLKQEILNWMASFPAQYDYKSAFLLDSRGVLRLSVSAEGESTATIAQTLALEAIRTKRVVLSDIHRDDGAQDIHLDLLTPILLPRGSESLVVGVLLLRIDPQKFLFTLIQGWPTLSHTSETLLIRREGNDVLFLNELRHRKGTTLSLRFPVSQEQLLSALAIRGQEGIVEELDYREVPVIAAVRRVPDSPWFVIAKTDKEEMYAPIRGHARIMIIMVIGFIGAAGFMTSLIWKKQQADFYRKQYEAKLEREALTQHFEYLTKFTNDIILLVDDKGGIVETNERAIFSYGYTRDEFIQLNIRNLRSPEERPQVDTQMRRIEEQNGLIFETIHQRKDGTTFPVEVSSRVMEIGGKKFYQGIIRDITERKRAEEALRETNDYLENLFNYANAPIIVWNPEFRITRFNPAFEALTGRSAGTVIGKSLEILFPPALVDSSMEFIRKTLADERWEVVEIGILHSDGSVRTVLWNSATLFSPDGKIPVATIAQGQDITERKRAEEDLRSSEKEAQRMAEETAALANIGRIIGSTLNIEEIYEWFARETQKLISYDRIAVSLINFEEDTVVVTYVSGMDIPGRRLGDTYLLSNSVTEEIRRSRMSLLIQLETRAALESQFSKFLPLFKGGLRSMMAIPLLSRDAVIGVLHFQSVKPQAFTDKDRRLAERIANQISGAIANAQLFAERKRAEEEIRKLNAELEQKVMERTANLEAVNKELEAFSYSVSHDLRAPLRSMDGFSQALLEDYAGILDDQAKDYLHRVRAASQHMAQLIDDLLNLSHVTSSEMRRDEVDLTEIAEKIAKEFREKEPDRQVELVITPGLVVKGDARLLRLMMENLLGNAWKFAGKHLRAKIELGIIRLEGERTYFVRDDGAGFDMVYADKLFIPFQRLHGASEFPGTGIGLATIRRIVHRHGGRVWAEGEVEKGATFYFTLG